ncbi:MAG: hypothetical protein NE328_21820 [Lentisphaeraceae bacterium]|nr:hypothetical protein [Lentisphaeraceae bacterium]
MKKEDDRNWSAYIDGELSVSEVEKFEALLSEEELKHLNNERAFEESIGNVLNDTPACPENLLSDIVKKAVHEDKKSFLKIKLVAIAAIAACIAALFLIPKEPVVQQELVSLVPTSVDELKGKSLTGDQLDDINRFLAEKKISLELTSVVGSGHPKKIIGAGVEKVAGEEVVTLLFTCCGRPAKVYLIPKGSKAEEMIIHDDSGIQAMVKKGNYRLAVSSPHNSESLLAYINQT